MTESSRSRTSSVASRYSADDARRFGGVIWLNSFVYRLVRPAARLMDRLRFSLKVALMGSIGALAIIVMLAFLVPMLNDSIRFVGLEREGAKAILPLATLMDEMQSHRGTMARVLNGDASAVPVAEKIRQENKATIQAVDDVLSHEPFPAMEQWAAIRDPWLKLSEAAAGLPAAESFAQHTALVRQTLKLLSYIADESNLSLDPVLDSYTLMDTVVNRLPAYWEEIGKLRGAGAGILASSDASEVRRVSLLAQRDIARYIYDRGDENFKSVIEHNPELASLRGLAQELEVRHQAFMKTFNEQFQEGHAPTISASDYFAQGTATIGAALALTRAVVPALDRMLAERDAELRSHRSIVLGVCGLCALAAIYCFLGFSRSLSATLRGLARASHQLADGEFPERIELHSKDELQDIADEIAKITVTLRRFDSAQREVARKHDEGATDVRIDSSQFGGAFAEMAEALNEAFDGHVGVQQRMADVMAHYARGDMSVRMEELPGRRAELSNAINQVRDRLNNVNDEILKLADAAARGEFSVRGRTEGLEFRFADMVGGLNRLMQNAEQGLNGLDQLMTGLAAGDLGVRMEGEFQGMFAQLRDNAHRTVDQLADIVSRIHISAEAIDSAAREIALGNNDLSSRTEQQAMLLQQTASSMDEATTTARQTTDSAQHANQLAVGARDTAELGGRTVSEAVEMMRRIQESSHRIRDIVTLIDGIAFQTNILALNAAVEAARAGEQGRGFAVVANEVRSLAQRSAQGARDIAALVADSVQRVDGGTVLVERAGTQMNDIVSSVSRVADLMQDIASASGEQTQGIEQVNQAVIQMDGATQQNAAMVEEASASARSLESEADNLVRTVNVFQLSGRNGRRREGSVQERSAA